MSVSSSQLWQLGGYAVALSFLVLPFFALRLVMGTRWFRERKRTRWATPEFPLLWWRGGMDRLPPPFNEYPEDRRRKRR